MTPLPEPKKRAYRHLLYLAMLDIRIQCQSRGKPSSNPLKWRSQYARSRRAGAIADWLHNLAHYSELDFERFDEGHFWREYDRLCEKFNSEGVEDLVNYRRHFEEHLLPEGINRLLRNKP